MRFKKVKRFATGGMGQIFVARDSKSGRRVVIKRLLPAQARDQRSVRDFLNEAQLMQRLKHPNIAEILACGGTGGDAFIAMEYIEGFDLHSIAEAHKTERRPPPIGFVSRVIGDAAQALQAAHGATGADGQPLGIVHRDVSTSNIIVGTDGISRLLDFGIAKAKHSDRRKTTTGIIRGKVAYLSPEQVAGLELDHRSDQFSLCVTLYELLTNVAPFSTKQEFSTLTNIVETPHIAPSKLRHELAASIDAVLERGLAKEVDGRFASCGDLCAALFASIPPWTATQVAEFLQSNRAAYQDARDKRASHYQVHLPDVSREPWWRLSSQRHAGAVLALVLVGGAAGALAWLNRTTVETQRPSHPSLTADAILTTEPTHVANEAAPATAKPGQLVVTTEGTWANVFVDGALRGQTPLILREVPTGPHQIALENPELHLRSSTSVVVKMGESMPVHLPLLLPAPNSIEH